MFFKSGKNLIDDLMNNLQRLHNDMSINSEF